MPLRVCDRCIRKKVKCNQARPTCSRCSDLGKTCTYTLPRRKPGPPRGSRYAARRPQSRPFRVASDGRATPPEHDRVISPTGFSPLRADPVPRNSTRGVPPQPTRISPSCSSYLHFSPQQEEYLIGIFFDISRDANPIFSKERFLRRYQDSLCNQDLITTMAIIARKLTHFAGCDGEPDIDAGLESLLSSSLLEDDLVGDALSLDQFRKAYILAFYEFHQFPGHHSWLRVGRVTRMSYRIGLDRLDHIRLLYPDWRMVSDEDIQEWRALWWRIYRLDTYSNLALGTPYQIDDTVINTSFNFSETKRASQGVLLPPNLEGLVELLPAIISDPETLLDNIHNITVATTRQAGSVLRMHMLRWQAGIPAQLAKIERQLTALRVSLPQGWLNPRRNVFSNETSVGHHARLITVFLLRMAQLLVSLVDCCQRRADDWVLSWQRILETCQDIAALAGQWDSAFSLMVDPAITFTFFTTLIFLDLHRKSASLFDDSLRSSIDHDINVLYLHLKHFGTIWTQARLLTLPGAIAYGLDTVSFESFRESMSGPISYDHIALMFSHFEAPLHPRWLQFLASAGPALESFSH